MGSVRVLRPGPEDILMAGGPGRPAAVVPSRCLSRAVSRAVTRWPTSGATRTKPG